MYLQLKRASMALFLSLFCFMAYAQKTVTGTVKDASGEPLIGVTIQTPAGTGGVTDIDGNFSIEGVNNGDKLTFSYVGCKAQSVTVGSQSTYNIIMQDDAEGLDEVVVVGYGTMKRRDLTGAVASVTGEKLASNPVSTVAEALQGQLPGVNVISQDGRPGATMSIRVRGGGSITQSNDPLFVVDGVQVSSIDDIAAEDIETLDVLKDAASTAIYGARGANGVIMITTKGAKEGKVSVRYNMYYQIKAKPDLLKVQDAYDHVYNTWAYAKSMGDTYADNVAKYYGLGSAYGNHLEEYRNQSAHNWMDDVLQNGHVWNHDLTISGGTQHTKYYAAVNYMNDKGTLINSGMRRWSANLKLSQDITKNLKLDIDARYTEMRFKGAQYNYATQAYTYNPIDNPLGSGKDSDLGMGSANVDPTYNPVAVLNDYQNIRNRYRLGVNTALTWNIIKGLTGKTELHVGRNWSETDRWDGGNTNGQGYNAATLTKGDGYNVRWDTTLSYDVQGLGDDHKLNVMVGNEVLASKSNSSVIYGTEYPAEWDMSYVFANIGAYTKNGKEYVKSTIGVPSHTLSWFGRANYTFLDRYMLTATFRADGSSKFNKDNHWGYFPAAAAAWRISDEPWMESAKDWLSNLKLRLSFGTSGNDAIDPDMFLQPWGQSSATINGQSVTTWVPTGDFLANPDLKWETTISRNIGLDFGFWNGKLHGSLDYYWNTTKDCLMLVPTDPSTGFSYQMQNCAKTSNRGIELSLNYNAINTKDFNLNFGMTMSWNKNKVEEIAEGVMASAHTNWGSTMRIPYYDYLIEEGKPTGLIQGFKSAGYYTLNDFTYENGVYTLNAGVPDNKAKLGNYTGASEFAGKLADGQTAFPGMAKFADTDQNGVVDDDDITVIGETQPDLTGGFNISGNWKAIDFALGFVYQIGGKVYNANVMHSMMGNKDTSLGQGRLAEYGECWSMYAPDANGDIQAVTDPEGLAALNTNAKYALPYIEYGVCVSDFIESASFLRLNTLTVGYTFPKVWTKKVGISNARIYFTGGNLFCIKSYSGLDPDINVSPNADSKYPGFPTPNYDFRSYPKSRTFTFGLNVTF